MINTIADNALTIMKTRYLQEDESPQGMFWRVANHVAAAEKPEIRSFWADKFFSLMNSRIFMPNSPTLFNAGTGQGCLSACFTLVAEDNMESIMSVATDAAMIQKFGGGVGFGVSKLRQKNAKISSTQGKACGPVSVLKTYSQLSDMITQGGKRHGANMGQLMCTHPDINEFIHAKDDDKSLQNFNISVLVTNDFMQSVVDGGTCPILDPVTGFKLGEISASDMFDDIVKSAWLTGDPGLGFIDEVRHNAPNPNLDEIWSSNPCSEQFLESYGSCNLGSINVSKIPEWDGADSNKLTDIVHSCIRFLDNVVTINDFPVEELRTMNELTRRVGLGVMGFADLLAMKGIRYGSSDSFVLAGDLMGHIGYEAWEASKLLAIEKGPFPNWKDSKFRNSARVRNSCVTSIAPTGSIAAISECSFGIEPFFQLSMTKNILDGQKLHEVNRLFVEALEGYGYNESTIDNIISEVERNNGSCQKANVPPEIKHIFPISMDVAPMDHLKIQAAFQFHTSNGVSKTINLPNDATESDIHDIYMSAWSMKCRGITVYRDGSKSQQVIETSGKKDNNLTESHCHTETIMPSELNDVLSSTRYRMSTGHGNVYIHISDDHHSHPVELFSTTGKDGNCHSAYVSAIGRLISIALRSGINPDDIANQLVGIMCHPGFFDGVRVDSIPDAMGQILLKHIGEAMPNRSGEITGISDKVYSPIMCPECSIGEMVMQEGCSYCYRCGYAKC